MLHGSIWNKIPQFALPVAATAILGQLFNAADIAVVGNFTGALRTVSVAAVSTNSAIIGLILNLFIGISLGANVAIAHAIGQASDKAVSKATHTAIVMALLGGGRHSRRIDRRAAAETAPHSGRCIPAGAAVPENLLRWASRHPPV